jgi:uncharacterized protein
MSGPGAGYFQVTAEPKMEDILASIRKAIQDDIGDAPPGEPRGMEFKGAMRELRVKPGDETERQSPQDADIEDIRNRIHRNRAMDEYARAAPGEPPPEAAGFAGILGGTVARPAEPPPGLRPSYREEDAEAHGAEYYADPQGQTDYGYGEPGYDGYGQDVRQAEGAYLPPQTGYDDERYQDDPAMMSAEATAAANAAFSRLADALVGRSTGDPSVQDVARDMLRAMLKQWLDENLPALVEQLVREEIERVTRRGR